MKILYLHQYFATPESATGTRSYEFARRLIAHGHTVKVITSAAHLPEAYRTLTKTTEMEVGGIPALIIPIPYSNQMSFPARIRAFLHFALLASFHASRLKADVIYATSTPLTIAIPAIMGHSLRRIPMVFEVRDLWPELPIAIGALRNPLLQSAAYALEWIAYHSAAHIVALSPGMAQGVMRRGIAENRVTVIPNSSDLDRFDLPSEAGMPIRAQLGLTPDQPLILYAGTFGLINNLSYLVDLAAAMYTIAPNTQFLLVGEGAEREKIRQRARDLGVMDINLTVWNAMPKTEIPAIFAAATMTTSTVIPLPELWHNSANKFFDSLAAGKPIAINHLGWQADLLDETGAGLVLPADDPQRAAQLLADFVHDPARLLAASQAARELGRTRFSRDLLAAQMEAVLKQVVGQP
ncbi:MAG: glycosyltransferase family 4 protein [Chloroflexota bacterium]